MFIVSQFLESKDLSAGECKKLARIIQDSVYKLLNMINLSLNIYSIEEGAYKLASSPFDLKGLLKRVINDHRLNIDARKINLSATVEGKCLNEDATVFEVNGEETLMYSMFSNLYKNAIEVSPAGEKVEIRVERKDEKYTVEIKNRGRVPSEMNNKFFDKYATSGKKGGTGLGTYSAKLIAELHKGRISMTSSDEFGTSIMIELPRNL